MSPQKAKWSWVPGLPSLGPSPSLWLLDPDPAEKSLPEFSFVFLVLDGAPVECVANRTGHAVTFDEDAGLLEVTDEKRYVEIDGRRHLVKKFELVPGLEEGPDEAVPVPPALTENTFPSCSLEAWASDKS